MIIALSGRMHSGKSELAKICEDRGFKILKFADGLKDLICKLICIDRIYLENNKEIIAEYHLSYVMLSEELDININILKAARSNNIFSSIREIMQFIGTDIIRQYKPNWHIDKLKQNITNGQNYCIDDMRFKNEKNFADSIGADSWYVVRPNNFKISNHSSEVDLNWYNFNNKVIINNSSLKLLKKRWVRYLYNKKISTCNVFGFKNKTDLRDYLHTELIIKNNNTHTLADLHTCSVDKVVWWCNNLLVPIDKHKYTYNTEAFLEPTNISSYYAGLLASDGCIKKSGNSTDRYVIEFGSIDISLVEGLRDYVCFDKPIYSKVSSGYGSKKPIYYVTFENSYIIENIKYWNLLPNKSCKEQIPDILVNNINCLKQWVVGLIDGDGSVFICKKTLGIYILSSKNVAHYLHSVIPIKGIITQHKNTALFEIKWYNYRAVDLFNWLTPKMCLERKWSNVNKFLSFNTKRKTLEFIS